jgi:hypothetical protein
MDTFTFSFIIPVKPGGYVAALESLRGINTTSCAFEILVAEGCSPSRQRNCAAQESRGDILYFLDDDSHVAPDCLATCAALFEYDTVAVAGGPSLTPASDTRLQQLFGSALSSVFGAGANQNRYRAVGDVRSARDNELILCNLAVRRDIFLSFGGLDERLYPNEENELLDRLKAAGHTLIHAPRMAIQRSQRKNLRLFIRQMFSYGRGRGQQTLIAGPTSPAAFIPLLFVFYLLSLPLTANLQFSCIPLYAYLALAILFSIQAAVSSGSLDRMLLLLLFPVMHVTNGFGLLYGLLAGGKQNAGESGQQPVTVRRIKEFGQSTW